MSTNGVLVPGYPTTTAKGIVLVFGGLMLTVERFGSTPGEYPRIDADYPSITYSYRGSVSREGAVFRPKAIWTFDGLISLADQATLQRMEAAYLGAPGPWTLYDYTKPFADPGARSRGLAPNSVADATGGQAFYYAVWNAEPVRAFRVVERNRNEDLISFQFQETEATTP